MLRLWRRWNVDSMTGEFRPIKGWPPETEVWLMHPADVPDVLGELRSRQAGNPQTAADFDL